MPLQVQAASTFGDPPQDLRRMAVAAQLVQAVEARFHPHPAPLGWGDVLFFHNPGSPIADIQIPGVYRIGTNLDQNSPDAELVFQAAQELGHVFLGACYSNFAIETLTMALAHDLLDAIPAYQAHLANNVIAPARGRLPIAARSLVNEGFADFIREARREEALPLGEEGRAAQTIAGELVRAGPHPWADFVGLAHATTPPAAQTAPAGNPQGPVAWRWAGERRFSVAGRSYAVRDALARFGWT